MTEPTATQLAFDAAFRELCAEHGIQAAYLSVAGVREDGGLRLVGGGDEALGQIMDATVRRVVEAGVLPQATP